MSRPLLVFLLVAVTLPGGAAGYAETTKWRAAEFEALRVGAAQMADVRVVLGPPIHETEVPNEHGAGKEIHWIYFWNEIPQGELIAMFTAASKVLQGVVIVPSTPLPMKDAVSLFGADFTEGRYDVDPCAADEDSPPYIASEHGSIRTLEYRDRGIALWTAIGSDEVISISYLNGSPIEKRPLDCDRQIVP